MDARAAFHFPAVIHRDHVTAGFAGAAPSARPMIFNVFYIYMKATARVTGAMMHPSLTVQFHWSGQLQYSGKSQHANNSTS